MRCFVDTSAWLALFREEERHHAAAVRTIRSLKAKSLVTSDYVIDETLTRVRMKDGHAAAKRVGEILVDEAYAHLEFVTPEDFGSAWAMFVKYTDKGLSLTDCAILAQTERLGLERIFAFDDDFAKVGRLVIPA